MIDPLDIPLMRSLRFCPHELTQQPTQNKVKHEPTPEEIAAATAALRATWSDAEYLRRAGRDPHAKYDVPECPFSSDYFTLPDIRS